MAVIQVSTYEGRPIYHSEDHNKTDITTLHSNDPNKKCWIVNETDPQKAVELVAKMYSLMDKFQLHLEGVARSMYERLQEVGIESRTSINLRARTASVEFLLNNKLSTITVHPEGHHILNVLGSRHPKGKWGLMLKQIKWYKSTRVVRDENPIETLETNKNF
jgi:hypothetical protein